MNKATFIVILVLLSLFSYSQNGINYDENKAGEYSLPEILKTDNGKLVKSKRDWNKLRRQEVLNLFQNNVYGKFPGKPESLHFEVRMIDSNSLSGKAVSKQVRVYFTAGDDGPYMDLILFSPRQAKKAVPVFVGLNFRGNQSLSADKSIEISARAIDLLKMRGENLSTTNRAALSGRWQVELLIERGYGLATAYYGDLEQDHRDGWKSGVRGRMERELGTKPESWSAIGAWAWGLSRIMDYLETDKDADAERVIVLGHSRLGKAALWAGANDTRFAAVISNNSGEGGAALTRRWFGETTRIITTAFPHWFIDKYKTYVDNSNSLPVDQHMLLSLIAPRPLYVASATDDEWADPKGEFLSLKQAEPVYALFKKSCLGVTAMPPPNQSIGSQLRYHIRTGKHDIVLFDWLQYIDFANRQVK